MFGYFTSESNSTNGSWNSLSLEGYGKALLEITRLGYHCANSGDTKAKVSDWNDLIPNRVIFNNPTTIVYWNDGSKTVVKCAEGETFNEEVGVQAAIVRKVFGGNRSEFLRVIENAYRQPKYDKNEKKE